MVDLSTLRNDVWELVYNHLQTGSYAISTDNIFSAYPDKPVDYPMVIIYPPDIKISQLTVGLGPNKMWEATITFHIEVYHTSAANVKSLADEVTNSLLSGEEIFVQNKLYNMEFTDTDYDWWLEGRKKIHMIAIDVAFTYKE